MLRKFLNGFINTTKNILASVPDVLEVAGFATVAYGIGLIYFPAGIIAAGVAALIVGYLLGGDTE